MPKDKYPQELLDFTYTTLKDGTDVERRTLLSFTQAHSRDEIHFKFEVFAKIFFSRYFTSTEAPFHDAFVDHLIDSYYGRIKYLNIGFRGCAKTSYTKLFIAFVLLNDRDAHRKYLKVLTKNLGNAKQVVTDVYNMCVEMKPLYGDIFVKEGDKKREETMASFTTTDGRKLLAGTIGITQRGHLQDAFRPDWIVFDDVEDRESITSLAQTEATIFRIDEAISSLSSDGSYMVNGNYISEEGVIQWFMNKPNTVIDKIPIMDADGNPTWPERYDRAKIELIKNDAEDFYGEYLCLKPDTLIHTRNGLKQISDIKIGDEVLTHNSRYKEVLRVLTSESDNLLDITVNDVITTITTNHPVLTKRGGEQQWVPAGELTEDDLVFSIHRGKL